MSHPKKYNLIYYNTDYDFTPQYFECVRPYVKHIYAQGCRITHPMITKIPSDVDILPNVSRNSPKNILCYLPSHGLFEDQNLHHMPGRLLRIQATEKLKNVPFITTQDERLSKDEYFKMIGRCRFVICLMGVGVDVGKIYEAAYVGATPIVLKNGVEDLYEKFGALVLDSWDDLTEDVLLKHVPKHVPDELFTLEYWLPTLHKAETSS
jgi:hypothetical protein